MSPEVAGSGKISHDLALDLLRTARRAQDNDGLADAYRAYVEATELDPENGLGWLGRGETASDPDEHLICLGFALALDTPNGPLRDRFHARLEERLARAQVVDARRLFDDGRELALVGLDKPAQRLMERAVELDPRQAEAWLWRAGLEPDRALALEHARKAYASQPWNDAAIAAVAWLQAHPADEPISPGSRDDGERAPSVPPSPSPAPGLEATEIASELKPANSPEADARVAALLAEGERYLQAGDKKGALGLFVRATEMDQHSERAWLDRASAAQDVDEALTSLEQALAINPENLQAREARTFLRVRKLREGARLRSSQSSESRGGQVRHLPGQTGSKPSPSTAPSHSRVLLLAALTILLVVAAYLILLR